MFSICRQEKTFYRDPPKKKDPIEQIRSLFPENGVYNTLIYLYCQALMLTFCTFGMIDRLQQIG